MFLYFEVETVFYRATNEGFISDSFTEEIEERGKRNNSFVCVATSYLKKLIFDYFAAQAFVYI